MVREADAVRNHWLRTDNAHELWEAFRFAISSNLERRFIVLLLICSPRARNFPINPLSASRLAITQGSRLETRLTRYLVSKSNAMPFHQPPANCFFFLSAATRSDVYFVHFLTCRPRLDVYA